MKKSLFFFLISFCGIAVAQPPTGYYNSAAGLTGEALQAALNDIIDNHTVIPYSGLWNAFRDTDKRSDGKVWDMYSSCDFTFGTNQCGNYSSECDCYNREHSWPKSWFGDKPPMNSDLFHIYPVDGWVNNKRSNYPFGTVSSPTWVSSNGSKLGNNTYPGYSGLVFEPVDEYKGDFARTYFYMSVRYYKEDGNWPGSPMTTGSQLKPWALKMMLEWHENDPVSTKETERNNAVYSYQHNRNPFIDHPEYAQLIWGTQTGVPAGIANPEISVYPVPAADFCVLDHSGYFNNQFVTVTLTDITGKEYVADYGSRNSSVTLNTASLSHGVYIVILMEQGKTPAHIKIVK